MTDTAVRNDIAVAKPRRGHRFESAFDLFLPVATVALCIYFSVMQPSFLAMGNLQSIAMQNAATLVIAVPFALLMMSGGIDLSVGSVVALAGVVAGLYFAAGHMLTGVLAALGVGLAFGLLNGILIGVVGMTSIVVTLGTLAVGRGLAQTIAPEPVFGFPDVVEEFGSGLFLAIPYLMWVAAAVCGSAMFALNRMPVGRHLVAVGVNRRAAFLTGLRVKRVEVTLYTLTALAAAVAGIMLVARFGSAPSSSLGAGLELTVLTAVLLGGVPFNGGKGALWRVIVGVVLLGILRNGTTMMNVTPESSNIITGAVLVVAAGLEIMRHRLRNRS